MALRAVIVLGLAFAGASSPPALTGTLTEATAWTWPVTGPVIRGFDPPDSPYGTGHRGIDIATAVGTPVLAPADGTVTFAGPVGGQLFVTIDHGGGLESTYSWVSALVAHRGQIVVQGQTIALSGTGHSGATIPHLHLGVRLADVYVDPLAYLPPPDLRSLIRLASMAA